jgi:hypothetical protein
VHYTGQLPYHGPTNGDRRKRDPVALYPGQHPALVDQALFDRYQEVRALMSCHPRKAQDYIYSLCLLSGLLYCGQCGRPMRTQATRGVRQYQKRACYDQMANLQSNEYSVIMNVGETLERFETLWSTGTALTKRNCCDLQSQQSSLGVSLSGP